MHVHSVYDTDMHFIIDPISRAIRNEAIPKTTVVQYDHNSERFTFEIPRYVEGHDMSTCNRVRVHYINIGSKQEKNDGVYDVEDLTISPESDDVVICSWLISQNATKLVGPLNFKLAFACESDGALDYLWNTAINKDISVSDGMDNGEAIVEQYADILEQWEGRIEALEQGGGGGSGSDGFSPIATVEQTNTGAVITITDKTGTTTATVTNGKDGSGYVLTDADISEISTQAANKVDVSGKLDKNQGSANAGKTLVVGSNGNLTLTDMPEGGSGTSTTEVFIATFGKTTFAEIEEAVNTGKACFCDHTNWNDFFPLTFIDSSTIRFSGIAYAKNGTLLSFLEVSKQSGWVTRNTPYSPVITITSDSTVAEIATAKAVYDYAQPDVFVATSYETTYAEIKAAVDAGKECRVVDSTYVYYLTTLLPTYACFSSISSSPSNDLYSKTFVVSSDNEWSYIGRNAIDSIKSESKHLVTATAVINYAQPKGNYLTDTDLSGAIDDALAQAKASGEFDGADGKNGQDGADGAPGADGKDGVSVTHSWSGTTLTVTSASGTSSANLKGDKGDKGDTGATGSQGPKGDTGATGATGAAGYTPVKGTDYWTETDKAEIVAAVIEALGGNPIFGVVDANNNIVVYGELADGTYSVKYEKENGDKVNIGNLVLDSNVYYTVTKNLTNCTISNSATQAIGGKSYSATITAKSGYELKSVSVTMGGQSVSVSGGNISIANVTGNIVITAVAEEVKASYTNLALPVGVGRIKGTGAIDSATTSARYTAPIPFSQGDTIRVKGLDLSTYNVAFYNDDAGTTINALGASAISNFSSVLPYTLNGDTYTITVKSNSNLNTAKTIRFSGTLMSGFTEEDVIVTVNEEIN